LKLGRFQQALDDAARAQAMAPDFPKVYFRKGQALQGLGRLEDAFTTFMEGMAKDGNESEWRSEILKTRHMQKDVRAKKGTWI